MSSSVGPREVRVCRCGECEARRQPADRSRRSGPKVKTEGRVLWRGHWYGYDPGVGYYVSRRTVGGKRRPFLLHRETYETHHGPIPDGFIVHHRNHNPFNNLPDNLVAITRSEHNGEDGHGTDALRKHGESLTFEDRSRHTKETVWANRKPKDFTCTACDGTFQSIGMRAKFCPPCREDHYARRGH